MTKEQFAENMVNKIINKLDNTTQQPLWKYARSLIKVDKLVAILVSILTEYDKIKDSER